MAAIIKRRLLSLAKAAGLYQPLDADLTAIAALATTSFGRSLLTLADAGAARTSLGFEYGTWTPTMTSGTGTITSTSTLSGTYWKIDRAVWVFGKGTIVNNGTGATSIIMSGLPFAADTDAYFSGRNDVTSGAQLQGGLASGASLVTLFTYNNTYPGGAGAIIQFSGSYRAAT